MLIPEMITALIISITVVVLRILEKRRIVQRKAKLYTRIEIIGIYIPAAILIGFYTYLKTDTSKEAVLVFIGIFFCVALWCTFLELWGTKKYNYIVFMIVLVVCYVTIRLITPHMLSSIGRDELLSVISYGFLSSFSSKEYRGRMIISSVIAGLFVLAAPYYVSDFEAQNKVERVSIAFAESKGYGITKNDRIVFWGSATRNAPIHVWLVKLHSAENQQVERHLSITYDKGEVTAMKDIDSEVFP